MNLRRPTFSLFSSDVFVTFSVGGAFDALGLDLLRRMDTVGGIWLDARLAGLEFEGKSFDVLLIVKLVIDVESEL